MRLALALTLLFATPALAQEPCLTGAAAREGVLVSVRHQMLNKTWQNFYVLRYARPVCLVDDEGGRHENQIEVGLFPRDEKQLARLVGKKVRIVAEEPIVGETQWHIRDLTFMDATARAVR